MSTAPDPTIPKKGPAGAEHHSLGAWYAQHKVEAIIGLAGIAVTVALYMRSRANAAGSSAGATTTSSSLYPTSVANTTGTDAYTGLESQILGLQQGLLTLQNPQGPVAFPGGVPGVNPASPPPGSIQSANPPAPTSAPTASPTPSPGWPNQADLGGQMWDVLGGFDAAGQYVGSNVMGGAPVGWTWTGQGNPEIGQLPPAGAQGVVAYTPNSTPVSAISAPGSPYTPGYSQGYTGPVAA